MCIAKTASATALIAMRTSSRTVRVRGDDDMSTMYTKSSKYQLLTDILAQKENSSLYKVKLNRGFVHLINRLRKLSPPLYVRA